ncbi:MAG: peptidoglycan-associated lipoprotein Pal [Acidobacteriota bacterium]|nr:peptidoglycan-associated lipoprotein Pal [Acidobacteriota bacterium]
MKRNWTKPIAVLFVLAAMLPFAACKKKPPTTTESARSASEAPTSPSETRVSPPSNRTPQDVSGEPLPGSVEEMNRRGYLQDAFFDYNQADLRDDARTALAANATWLKGHATTQFLIEGHCDSRGTTEYNLALGDRRANAAREYLTSLGIDGSRIRTVSYGKERPFCNAESEECWQQNRRAHFLFTAK